MADAADVFSSDEEIDGLENCDTDSDNDANSTITDFA